MGEYLLKLDTRTLIYVTIYFAANLEPELDQPHSLIEPNSVQDRELGIHLTFKQALGIQIEMEIEFAFQISLESIKHRRQQRTNSRSSLQWNDSAIGPEQI